MATADSSVESVVEETVPALYRRPSPDATPCTAADLDLPEKMDGDGPLVSVILPTYNDEEYLPDAVESVGAQTHRNLELIVVDSSRVSWVEALADDREWVRYLSQDPMGLPRARNDGVDLATGEFIALLDADDYWHPEKLELSLNRLEDEADVVYTEVQKVDLRDDRARSIEYVDQFPPGDDPLIERINGSFIAYPSSVVFRRSALPNRPFNESLDAWEDAYFNIETFRNHHPEHVPYPLTIRRIRDDSISNDSEMMVRNKLRGIEMLEDRYPELVEHFDGPRAKNHKRLGRVLLRRDEKHEARRHLAAGLRLEPLDYQLLVMYGASFVPVDGNRSMDVLASLHDAILSGE